MEVLPTHFGTESMGTSPSVPSYSFGQVGVSQGEVKEVIPLGDKRNQSKLQEEYHVEVTIRNGMGSPAPTRVPCRVVDGFGGIGDWSGHSYRPATKNPHTNQTLSNGAQVLVVFVNGDTSQGFIIGAIRNDQAAPLTLKGRFYQWLFNGVKAEVNDDGELQVGIEGPTINDGTPDKRDDNQKGPYLKFTKDGNIYATDNHGQSILLNSKAQSVTVQATKLARLEAAKIALGAENAKENLLLGQQMVLAMSELVSEVFIKNASSFGKGSGTIVLDPNVIGAIGRWKMKWFTATAGPAKVLSTKAFTER